MYKDPVRTAQHTLSVSIIRTNQLMLYWGKKIALFLKPTQSTSTLCGQKVEL
jgi:hypothetical protein